MGYRLSDRARKEIRAIWRYIAQDNDIAADRWVDQLVQQFRILASMPYAGYKCDDIREGYRAFPSGNHPIFYRIADPDVHIMHIVHGSRDLINYPFSA